MNPEVEQQQRHHQATMDFFQSASDAWDEIKELLKADDLDRRKLEESFNDHRCKPKSDNQASAK